MADQPQDKSAEIIAAIKEIGSKISNPSTQQELAQVVAQIEEVAGRIDAAVARLESVSRTPDASAFLLSEAMNMISNLESKVDALSQKIDNLPSGGLA